MTSYRTRDNQNVEVVVDKSGAALGIEFPHEAAHRDALVTASEYVADLDVSGPRVYLIKAPADFEVHVAADLEAAGGCLVDLYKSPTVADDGTALQIMRNQLHSSHVSVPAVFHSPTVSDNGEKVYTTRIPGQTSNPVASRIGGRLREGSEIIIGAGESALIIVTAEADNTKFWSAFEYYEVGV